MAANGPRRNCYALSGLGPPNGGPAADSEGLLRGTGPFFPGAQRKEAKFACRVNFRLFRGLRCGCLLKLTESFFKSEVISCMSGINFS